jgi:hypothetical protein
MQQGQQEPGRPPQPPTASYGPLAERRTTHEYLQVQARRIRTGKEQSARQGTHQGPPPLGYRSSPRSQTTLAMRTAPALVPDPVYAPLVHAIFTRYATGDWSYLLLAEWLNGDPTIPPPPKEAEWYVSTVAALLCNPLYCGLVRYNHRPEGAYDRAEPGSEFLVPGRHPALIDRALFDRATALRAEASTQPSYTRHTASLGTGLFLCASCGGPMTTSHQGPRMHYRCSWQQRRKGLGGRKHTAPAYAGDLAHEALLREVQRLHRASLTLECGDFPVGDDDEASAPAHQCSLAEVRTVMELTPRIECYLTRGDKAGLRALVRTVVASVRIVQRVPERRPTWLHAEVTWQPGIAALLQTGCLRLAQPSLAPEQSVRAERHREAQRRYSARHRHG